MVRASRVLPNVYFGKPGAWTTLPYPRGGVDRPYDRLTYDFTTGTGQHMVSAMANGSRPYTVNWQALHVDNFALIEAYWTGVNGVGPWAFIDPSMTNMLLPNQAAPTNQLMDTSGFATATGAANMGTLLSNTSSTFIHRAKGTRSLRWQFTVAAATTPELNLTPAYRNWPGIPVVDSLPYVLTAWARPDGVVDSSITMALCIQWYNAAFGGMSVSTSGTSVMTGWTKLTCSATPPAGAAFGKPFFQVTGSTVTTGASIYIDEIMFEQDTVANTWAPGTGLRAVEILALPENSPFDARFRKDLPMTLRELA